MACNLSTHEEYPLSLLQLDKATNKLQVRLANPPPACADGFFTSKAATLTVDPNISVAKLTYTNHPVVLVHDRAQVQEIDSAPPASNAWAILLILIVVAAVIYALWPKRRAILGGAIPGRIEPDRPWPRHPHSGPLPYPPSDASTGSRRYGYASPPAPVAAAAPVAVAHDDGFGTSMAIAAMTDDPLLGMIAGGNPAGALLGAAMAGHHHHDTEIIHEREIIHDSPAPFAGSVVLASAELFAEPQATARIPAAATAATAGTAGIRTAGIRGIAGPRLKFQ